MLEAPPSRAIPEGQCAVLSVRKPFSPPPHQRPKIASPPYPHAHPSSHTLVSTRRETQSFPSDRPRRTTIPEALLPAASGNISLCVSSECTHNPAAWSSFARPPPPPPPYSLESAYILNESDALVQAWRKEGVGSLNPPAMPSVLVQGVALDFARHAWTVESERTQPSLLIPVRVDGCAAPIAFMRCCFLALSTEDGKKRKGKSTVKSDRRWLHGQKLDGAYLVMHGRKVTLQLQNSRTPLPHASGTHPLAPHRHDSLILHPSPPSLIYD